MSGRDPISRIGCRAAGIVFVLTFVIAFGVAALQLLHSLASAGILTPVCLPVVAGAPAAVVGGYEWQGHHRTSRALAQGVNTDAA